MTENGDKKEFGLPGVCGIALFTVLFCVLFPYLGFVSLAAVTAMTGVLVASWRNPLCFAVPLLGIAAAMLIWKSVPAGVILAALVLSGIVLGLVMRTHRSALSHVLSVVISYAVIAAAAYCICCIVYYGGISNGTAAFADRFTEYVSETFAALAENDTTGTVSALLESVSAEKYASSMLLVLPGIAAVAIEILGYVTSLLSRLVIKVFSCPSEVYPSPRNIVLPFSYAILAVISFALSLAAGGTVVGYVSQNLGTALCPALIVVGFGRLWSTSGRSGGIHRAVILVICILISLIVPAVAVYAFAASGVAAVISDFVKSKTNNQ